MNRTGSRAGGVDSRGGFSLVELLLVMALSGVIGATLVSVIRAQGDFYRHHDDTALVAQNLRATTDVLGSELRLGAGDDLLAAEPDSVVLRFDIARGVVCDSIGIDEAIVFMFDSVSAPNLPSTFRGVAYSPPLEPRWSFADGSAPAIAQTGAVPRDACLRVGTPASGRDDQYRRLVGWRAAFSAGAPPAGSLIRWYGRLTYRLRAASGTAPVLALRRNSQELTTPFASPSAFAYRTVDGALHAAVSPPGFVDVVEVVLSATATGAGGRAPPLRRLMYGAVLRNTHRSP